MLPVGKIYAETFHKWKGLGDKISLLLLEEQGAEEVYEKEYENQPISPPVLEDFSWFFKKKFWFYGEVGYTVFVFNRDRDKSPLKNPHS